MDNFGRKKIYTDAKSIDDRNIIHELQLALMKHLQNKADIQFLLDYEKGKQPILDRIKEIRPEINVKIVENNAAKITDFKVGYEFGSPVTYVQRAKVQVPNSDADKDDIRITALNDMLYEESKSSKDVELARYFKICGVGYRMIKAKPKVEDCSVFDILTLNPLYTFIVYSNDIYKRPMLAVTYSPREDGTITYGCYTKEKYYEVNESFVVENGDKKKDYTIANRYREELGQPNVPSVIPIVAYFNDYDLQGCFEKVIPLLDAINITNSDRVNDVVQHVQSLLWLHNCQLPDDFEVKSNGLIETKSPTNGAQANIKYLDQPLEQTQVQTLVDYLQREAMEITGTPERQENSGGSTGSAMSLSSGWQVAETLAQTSDSMFDESEKQCIKIMLEIIKISNDIPEEYKDIVNLKLSDIQIRHSRNKIYDIATKTNALATMLNSGIDALHAIETVCLFTNPQAAYTDSKEAIKKMQSGKQLDISKTQNTEVDNPSKVEKPNKDRTMQDSSDQDQKSEFSG